MDQTAGEIFCAHLDFAYRVALSAARNPVEAEDVVQEAYLRFVHGWNAFDRSRPVRPYLTGVVIHAAMDRARSEQRRSAREEGAAREANMNAPAAYSSEHLAALRQALPRMEPDLRVAVSLHYLEGLTLDELAESLSVPRSTARNLVQRGLDELRRLLTAAGFAAIAGDALPEALGALPQPAAPAALKLTLTKLAAAKLAPTGAAAAGVAKGGLAKGRRRNRSGRGHCRHRRGSGFTVHSSGFTVGSSTHNREP